MAIMKWNEAKFIWLWSTSLFVLLYVLEDRMLRQHQESSRYEPDLFYRFRLDSDFQKILQYNTIHPLRTRTDTIRHWTKDQAWTKAAFSVAQIFVNITKNDEVKKMFGKLVYVSLYKSLLWVEKGMVHFRTMVKPSDCLSPYSINVCFEVSVWYKVDSLLDLEKSFPV